jgi:hypothetical protein
MEASPSRQCRSQSRNPISQKSVSRRERNRRICPLVQRNIAPRARPRFGLSRTHSERLDCAAIAKSLTSEEIFEFTRLLAPHPVFIVGASFIISVDSGPMHIAAAITPDLLSIHTWTDPRRVGPYNPDAWIWKNQRIEQVRAIADEVRSKRSRGRPNLFQLAKFVHRRLLQ